MQISEAAGGNPETGTEPCRFPKLEECAHFHYERVQLPQLKVTLQTNMDQSLHSQHTNENDDEFFMIQVTSGDECWLLQRNVENFKLLDAQLHQCIYDRKISQLQDLSNLTFDDADIEAILISYLNRFSNIADNSVNCGPVLNWLQMDNKGHRLLVPSEESRSINTPAVAAAYSVRRYVSQALDELNLEVGDMISVIDMASPGESMWWRGKRGFQVGFFPQHCVHIIGDKVPRNMPLPPPVVGSLAISPIKPVLRKHGKLIAFFRSFILNRPSRRRLKQSGILKERVFGCDLGEHLLNSGHDIPTVLKCCAEFIEQNGIVDGIYRLSGITSNIQKLRNAFDEDRIPNLYTEDILQDIHSVASLLKMYFRELPNPLCTYQLYQSFVNAVQGCNNTIRNSDSDRERLLKMREAVQKLPPPHYRTLEYLMRHLARVAKHGASTGMTTRNVAIVWAPNLLRCAELEVGGVAALQGVGVQAVVTEFLICYSDLIFCDHLPYLDQQILNVDVTSSPKRTRPKSLAISTPTKLITLEEARSKHLLNKIEDCGYIEVGGGPNNLPKEYHTIIELPHRKRGHSKRSPWRSFFSKSRNSSSQGALNKNRKASTPGDVIPEKFVTDSELCDVKRKLRTVKSAESLTSGHSEPTINDSDILGPLHTLNKAPGHNRSVSHDSYFDTLQNSQNNSEGSLLDLSEIQMNFELEESEMRIFSEDESLVSSPRIPKEAQRRVLTRARPEEFNSATNSGNPSPKKQARVVISPDSMSRKRTRLEDQLSDIQYIDCNTPDNVTVSTTAVIHTTVELQKKKNEENELYQPKNKSPRSSAIDTHNYHPTLIGDSESKRQSLNLENNKRVMLPKSLTEVDIVDKNNVPLTTPTPQSPNYRELIESSANTTPDMSPQSPQQNDVIYQKQKYFNENLSKKLEDIPTTLKKPKSPKYENVLTTISITYKSPNKTLQSPRNEASIYEEVLVVNPEKAVIPTSTASLPIQEALVPKEDNNVIIKGSLKIPEQEQRPKSLSALDDSDINTNLNETIKSNSNPSTMHISNNNKMSISKDSLSSSQKKLISSSDYTVSSSKSSELNLSDVQTAILHEMSSNIYRSMDNVDSPTDLSLSEIVINTSSENIHSSQSSVSFPISPSQLSPIVSPCTTTTTNNIGSSELLNTQTPPNLTPSSTNESLQLNKNESECSLINEESSDLIKSSSNLDLMSTSLNTYENFIPNLIQFSPTETSIKNVTDTGEEDIYQQVKYYRRSIHEINALLDIDEHNKREISKCSEQELDSNEKHPDSTDQQFDSIEQQLDTCDKFDTNEIFDSKRTEAYDSKRTDAYDSKITEAFDSKRTESSVPDRLDNSFPKQTSDSSDDKLELTDKSATFIDSDVYEDVPSARDVDKNAKMKSNESLNNIENLQSVEFDSLSSDNVHIYENILSENPQSFNEYENVKFTNDSLQSEKIGKVDVKSLTNVFEVKIPKSETRNKTTHEKSHFLPPCLRARNSKQAIKTRSLDEDEFKREFETTMQRRKSLEDAPTFTLNSPPKRLNDPKKLPGEMTEKIDDVHLIHSTDNLLLNSDQKLNRERIEKYKEERRKFLHDKYRSESFKEDKDVLLSRLKVFKNKDEIIKEEVSTSGTKCNKLDRRKNSNGEEIIDEHLDAITDDLTTQSLKDDVSSQSLKDHLSTQSLKDHLSTHSLKNDVSSQLSKDNLSTQSLKEENKILNSRESFRLRAAKFETNQNNLFTRPKLNNSTKNLNESRNVVKTTTTIKPQSPPPTTTIDNNKDDLNPLSSDMIRVKKSDEEILRHVRRHTFDTRERERDYDSEWNKRANSVLESKPKKEKTSPSYCIKDMKAIFESKSQQ